MHEVVSAEFARARIFLSLLELDDEKLAEYIKQHKQGKGGLGGSDPRGS